MSRALARAWVIAVAALLTLAVLPAGNARADTVVNIPDSNLRACINDALGRWDDDQASVTQSELAWITNLNCFSSNVRSLVGLEHATRLRVLTLSFNDIRTINIPQIRSLEELDLAYNNLTSISLASVPNIKRLDLKGNEFTTLDIRNSAALTEIDASSNSGLTNVVLQSLPKLTTVDVSNGAVLDVRISRVPTLRHLDLRDNARNVAVGGITTATEVMLKDEYVNISSVDSPGSCSRPDPVKCSTIGEHAVSIWYGYYRTTYKLRVDAVGQQFTDVPPGAAFYEDIQWMAGSGISAGYADGTYRPNANVHRAAMAAFMYRMAGSPAFTAPKVSPFKDVKPGDPFYKEIAWMKQAGISAGNPDGTYRPYDNVSRGATPRSCTGRRGSRRSRARRVSPT